MSTQTERLDDLARDLGEAIAESDTYAEFDEARAAVEADEEIQDRIEAFERLRRDFMIAREAGNATREDLRELEQAQRKLHERPVMAEYLDAKERLQERLEDVNRAISEPLAVDFGGEAGGCCHD